MQPTCGKLFSMFPFNVVVFLNTIVLPLSRFSVSVSFNRVSYFHFVRNVAQMTIAGTFHCVHDDDDYFLILSLVFNLHPPKRSELELDVESNGSIMLSLA